LPEAIPFADAVHNLQRLAYLLGALAAGDAARLRFGLGDRLHESLRLQLVPGLAEARAALDAEPGCAGASLSGSGPALLGWIATADSPRPSGAAAVAALARHGIEARVAHARPAPGATWTATSSSA
jgi:homoserine kinase